MLALRPLAKATGLVDRPGGRKSHIGEVPVMGGIAMFFGAFSGLLVFQGGSPEFTSLIFASFLLLAIGVLDDRFELPSGVRFATQFAVSIIMIYGAGIYLQTIGNPFGFGNIDLGFLAGPFTIIVSLTVINAYNLVDGVDGLAGSLAAIALLGLTVIGGYGLPTSGMALAFVAAIAGFLCFNFPVILNRSVRSFMGDAGSTLLGFTIVWITVSLTRSEAVAVSPVICLWLASIPIYDCLTCFVRRAHRGKSPFTPGRDHFHHVLKRSGLGVRQVLGVLTGFQLIYALIAIVGFYLAVPDFLMFAGWAICGLMQRQMIKAIAKYHRFTVRRRRNMRPLFPAAG